MYITGLLASSGVFGAGLLPLAETTGGTTGGPDLVGIRGLGIVFDIGGGGGAGSSECVAVATALVSAAAARRSRAFVPGGAYSRPEAPSTAPS